MASIQPYSFEPVKSNRSSIEDLTTDNSSESEDETSSITTRLGNTEWCSCGNCRPMSQEKESICCQEVSQLDNKLES